MPSLKDAAQWGGMGCYLLDVFVLLGFKTLTF